MLSESVFDYRILSGGHEILGGDYGGHWRSEEGDHLSCSSAASQAA